MNSKLAARFVLGFIALALFVWLATIVGISGAVHAAVIVTALVFFCIGFAHVMYHAFRRAGE